MFCLPFSAEVSQAKMNITRIGAALVGRVFDLSGEIDVEFQMYERSPFLLVFLTRDANFTMKLVSANYFEIICFVEFHQVALPETYAVCPGPAANF